MHDLFETIKRADQAVANMCSRALVCEHQISQRQYVVLKAAVALHGANQSQLTRKTGIDRSTISDIIGRMIKKGWLVRSRGQEDMRAYIVEVTDTGFAVLAAAEPAYAAALAQVLGHITEDDLKSTLKALMRVIAIAPSGKE